MASDLKHLQEKYLGQHQLLVYFEDAVAQLLKQRSESHKVNAAEFLHAYFKRVVDDKHIFQREYAFVKATSKNRAALVKTFWLSYKNICRANVLMHIMEYHSLMTLICPDFPVAELHKTARIILLDGASDCLIAFPEFMFAFQLQFYYQEFIEALRVLYIGLQSGSSRAPTTGSNAVNSALLLRPQRSSVFLTSIRKVIYCEENVNIASYPPLACIEDILSTTDEVTYFGLLMALTKCDAISSSVGALPLRHCLFDATN